MIYKDNKRIVEVHKGDKEYSDIYYSGKRVFKNWEEYSGGVPASIYGTRNGVLKEYQIYGDIQQNGTPSSEAPVEVLGCGDRTRNLFDFKSIYSDSSNFEINGNSVSGKVMSFYSIKINLCDLGISIGDTFTFSSIINNNPTTTRGRVAANVNGRLITGKGVTDESYVSFITSTVETIDDYIFIVYGNNGLITASNIQLELGSEPTPYVPYGYEIPVVSRGKNLLKEEYPNISSQIIYMPVYVGEGTFTLSSTTPTYNISAASLFFFSGKATDGASNGANGVSSIKSRTVTSADGYVTIAYRTLGTITPKNYQTQLELGSEATPYEPYRAPITTPIYLPEPLYKDDYILKDKSGGKVHRAWGVKVFDGSENWKKFSNNTQIFCAIIAVYDMEPLARDNGFCSHYRGVYTPTGVNYNGIVFGTGDRNIFILTSNVDNLSDFKAFLASEYAKGTPVTVYYSLAEPTEEPIELPDLPLEIGYNMIDVDTSIKPSEIYMKYNGYKK